jgi:NitT/TauT family transport system ATP-binding protein
MHGLPGEQRELLKDHGAVGARCRDRSTADRHASRRRKLEAGGHAQARGLPAAARRDRIARQVELMSLQGYESAYPHQLSGGMQQRVAIARSYVLDPDVLLMDEPFGALDAQTRIVMQEELIKLSRVNPRTVLFITHAVDEAVYLADRVVVMTRRPGRIREIVDVAPVRKADNWDRHDRTEEVMDQESFVHLRTHIWRMLRGEQQTDDPNTLETTGGMT